MTRVTISNPRGRSTIADTYLAPRNKHLELIVCPECGVCHYAISIDMTAWCARDKCAIPVMELVRVRVPKAYLHVDNGEGQCTITDESKTKEKWVLDRVCPGPKQQIYEVSRAGRFGEYDKDWHCVVVPEGYLAICGLNWKEYDQ